MSSSDESMDENSVYEDYEDTTDDDIEDFIDDNNYTLNDIESDENQSNHSIEIIDSESNQESNQINEIIEENPNHNNESDVNEELQRLVNSEHNYDSKPDIKPLNESFPCTQDNCDNSCIICTEMWTTTGEHQLVALNCGHLFGRKCIEHWLDPKKAQNQRCPQCNKTAKKRDIRVIYARNLRALDTSERDRAVELLEEERRLRKKIEAQALQTSIKMKEVLKENERLKKEYIDCQKRVQNLGSNHKMTENAIKSKNLKTCNKRSVCFEFVNEIPVNSSGDCRHLGYSSFYEIIAVSQPNPNTQLFPGFGVRKIFLNDFKSDNICIHSKAIRDLEINAYDGTILTTSLDKTVKLTSLLNKTSILTYSLEVDAWSVTFNPNNRHEFYVGLNNGNILLFDNRMLSSHMDNLNCSDSSPVVSLNQIEFQSSADRINGILSTQFQNFSLYERNNSKDNISSSDFTAHKIPIEGRFGSAHFEPKLGLALLSCRPSSKHTNKTHYVMEFKVMAEHNRERTIEPEVIQIFEGGKQQVKLSRSRIFANPSDENSALIFAADESSNGALIWDLNSSACMQKIVTKSPVLDMSLIQNSKTDKYFMTALTGTSVMFYKYNS